MALPTLDQYRQGATTWKREHKGVGYTLSHHGVSSYSPQGTWCFYIHLLEEQFQRPEDFARFDREPEVREFAGTYREHYPCEDVPDYGFHGGITWYSRKTYRGRRSGEPLKALKIGCDYAHLWDQEGGYWQGLDDVEADAHKLIDALTAAVPLKERCAYSGVYDLPDQFYTARNGNRVHRSNAGKFSEASWSGWLPADQAEAAAQPAEA
jgi:hypothetical protein